MSKVPVKCGACNGKGGRWRDIGGDIFLGIITAGLHLALRSKDDERDFIQCEFCNGKGYIVIKQH